MNYMDDALKEAYKGIRSKHGGPFGAVVVKDGKVVGKGHNMVLKNNDPTAHGEVQAIRNACKNLGTYDLSGCEIYTTAEPCPMCRAAIMWSNIGKIYYGCNVKDTDKIGFRDNKFYKKIDNRKNLIEKDRDKCLELFKEYKTLNPTIY